MSETLDSLDFLHEAQGKAYNRVTDIINYTGTSAFAAECLLALLTDSNLITALILCFPLLLLCFTHSPADAQVPFRSSFSRSGRLT